MLLDSELVDSSENSSLILVDAFHIPIKKSYMSFKMMLYMHDMYYCNPCPTALYCAYQVKTPGEPVGTSSKAVGW